MKLDEFITESLKSIVKGVSDAQEFALSNKAEINPKVENWDRDKMITSYYKQDNKEGFKTVSTVNFDIAVTATDTTGTNSNSGINVYSLKLGREKENSIKNESLSRISFSVTISLPIK